MKPQQRDSVGAMVATESPLTAISTVSDNSIKQLTVEIGGYSTAGVKATNQDAFAAHQPSSSARRYKGVVACIADGVSCSENSQLASQTAVTTFIDDYYSTPDSWNVTTAATRVLSSLNDWLYRQGQNNFANHNGLITTFSAVILKSQTAYLFHAGDSRIYRFRAGDLELLTIDHVQPQRGDSVLTRALGIDSHLEVDYRKESLEQGDLLILTTDGVHETLNHQQFRQTVKNATTDSQTDLENLSQGLIEQALLQKSTDNLSCLVVKVSNLPVEDIDEVYRHLTDRVIPPVLDVGMTLDQYQVLQVIYSGTRSHLYLVKEVNSGERLVLKAPSQNFVEDVQYLEGFLRESWVARRIDNSAVMKVFTPDTHSKFLYHVCEYIEGQTLRQWIHDNPKPSLESVRQVTKGVIQGLRVFKRLGMVHRDVKPENIMLCENGQIKLIDFGTVQVGGLSEITSVLAEEYPVGSVDYIAPEYLLGKQGTSRSDMFSLGVIVYEMLSGHQPFNMSNAHLRVPTSHLEWKYKPISKYRNDIPVWLDLCLKKATAPNTDLRYHVWSEFMADLCTPNSTMLAKQDNSPLLERNPLKFWQLTSLLLFIVVVVLVFN